MGAAAPVFTVAMGAAQYKAQGEIGKYNQSVNNRNALVLEGQADQIEAKAEFDIAQFQKDFKKMEGETTVACPKSGVELGTGTAYNIELSNAYEAKLQEIILLVKAFQSGIIDSTNYEIYFNRACLTDYKNLLISEITNEIEPVMKNNNKKPLKACCQRGWMHEELLIFLAGV